MQNSSKYSVRLPVGGRCLRSRESVLKRIELRQQELLLKLDAVEKGENIS